jgi:hypothetical protein
MEILITLSFASTLILSLIAEFKNEDRIRNVQDFLMVILSFGLFLGAGNSTNNNLLLGLPLLM